MTREEHKNIVTQLLSMVTAENQANASQFLTQLSEDYEATLTASETLQGEHQTLQKNFETLRNVNSELFLKVGATRTETHKNEPPKDEPSELDGLTFEKLFNDKGELL